MLFLTLFILRLIFRLFYHVHVYGTEHIYQKGAIIAPNHNSFLDPPLIGITWPQKTHYLARATLFKNFFVRKLLLSLKAFPVHGSGQDINSLKIVAQLLKQDKKVVIFPEGVRSLDGSIQNIKTGVSMLAFRTGCPIIPVYIHGTFETWSRHRKWPKIGSTLACVYGEPIFPETYSHLNKKDAREAMTKELQRSIQHLAVWYLNQNKTKTGNLSD